MTGLGCRDSVQLAGIVIKIIVIIGSFVTTLSSHLSQSLIGKIGILSNVFHHCLNNITIKSWKRITKTPTIIFKSRCHSFKSGVLSKRVTYKNAFVWKPYDTFFGNPSSLLITYSLRCYERMVWIATWAANEISDFCENR